MGIDIDALEALAKAAPSGKWETWTSCSWRRIMADDGKATRRVIEPTYHPTDNWPDLLFGEGVSEFIEAAQPSVILMLIDELRLLRAFVDANAADRRRLDSGCLVLQEREEFGEAHQCEHRGLNLRAVIDAAQSDSTGQAEGDDACCHTADAAARLPVRDQITPAAVGIAYGYLWHIVHPETVGPTEAVVDPYHASQAARRELVEVLSKDDRANGIAAARIQLASGRPVATTDKQGGDLRPPASPIDVVLYCPVCHAQHIDAPDDLHDVAGDSGSSVEPWTNPPHRSHLCHHCKNVWRPADVPTNGVAAIATRGTTDTWPKILPDDIHASVDCWCETCRPVTLSDMRMVLCPDCGNKRCPRATNHRNLCTNSNEAGQPGSSWEGVKPIGARKRDTEPQGPA